LLNRRTFVAGLGAASLLPWPRSALAAPQPLSDDIRVRIIDTAFDLTTRAKAIRQAGIRTVIRYYAHGPGQWTGKVLSAAELDALEANDLSVAVVFQHNNNVPDNFLDPDKKVLDVEWARRHAASLRQPAGSAIYFGADFDLRHWQKGKSDPGATEQRIAAVKGYFEHARAELAKDGFKLGVYGCGRTLEILEGVADYFWLSASAAYWRSGEYYNSGQWHLYQNRIDLTRSFGDAKPCPIDTNLANPSYADFGQWRRDGRTDAGAQAAAQRILDARSFVAVQQLCLTRAHPERDRTPLKADALSPDQRRGLRYALSVKILHEDGDYCGVSLDEGDSIAGYCRKADLSADGSMPLKANRRLAPNGACSEPQQVASTPAEPRQRFALASADSGSVPLPAPKPVAPKTIPPKAAALKPAAPATAAPKAAAAKTAAAKTAAAKTAAVSGAAPAAEAAAPKLGALTPFAHGIN
jgi:hypothetical protein